MKIVNLFKNKKEEMIDNLQNAVDEAESDENQGERVVQQIPQTVLVWTDEQSRTLPEPLRQHFEEVNQKMPPLRFDELNLVPFEVGVSNAGYYVNLFVRNGTENVFSLQELNLSLLDASGDVVSEGLFQFDNFGTIRMGETRPWTFEFTGEQIKKANPDFTDFTVAASLPKQPEFQLAIPKEWHEQMNEQQIQGLVQIVNNMPEVPAGTVNLTGFQAKFDQDGNLQIMLMFRNATKKDITFHTLPLFVRDNAGDIVAEGAFELGNFEVKAYHIKPWMFIFPKDNVKKPEPDFSRWVVFTKGE